MHFEGTEPIKTSQQKVWEFITSPETLAKCLPDVENLESIDATQFKVGVKVGISFIKAKMNLTVQFSDLKPPSHAKITVRGSGTGSTIDVEATIDLSPSQEGTALAWKADAQVGGTIAGVGSRLIGGVSEKKTAEFFQCIKGQLEQ